MDEQTVDSPDLWLACAREPIHIPGAVQPHGALLLVERDGRIVRQVSESAQVVLGLPVGDLIERPLPPWLSELLDAAVMAGDAAVHEGMHRIDDRLLRIRQHERGERLLLECIDEPAATARRIEVRELGAMVERLREGGAAELGAVVANWVHAVSGYDRVMIYRFDRYANGEVIAAAVAEGVESYLGHHFPAADIPSQARALLLQERVRIIRDSAAAASPLRPLLDPVQQSPLDLTGCELRAASPIHLEYLRNMGVGASLTVSLVVEGRLWGLIACHHCRPFAPTSPVAQAVALAGSLLASRLEGLARQRLNRAEARGLALQRRLVQSCDPRGRGQWQSQLMHEDLLHPVAAHGAIYDDGSRRWRCGHRLPAAVEDLLLGYLHGVPEQVHALEELAVPVPALAEHAAEVAGALGIRLGSDRLVWFRREQVHAVTWGGDPAKGTITGSQQAPVLHPRRSFAGWVETVRGRCRDWSHEDLLTAEAIRNVLLDALQGHVQMGRSLVDLDLLRVRRGVEGIAQPALILDRNGEPTLVNRSMRRLLGTSVDDEDFDATIMERIHRQLQIDDHSLRSLLDGDAAWQGEARVVDGEGRTLPVQLGIDPIQDEEGGRIGAVLSLVDLSLHKQAQQQLESSNRALSAFAHTASHDLQTPLRSISVATEALRELNPEGLDEQTQRLLEMISSGTARMRGLVRDLLDYARLETDPPSRSPVDLGRVTELVVEDLADRIATTGAELEVADLPVVNAVERMMQQLLQNLIGNALEYRHPERPPQIRIEAQREGDAWRLCVADNGTGFDQRHAEQIFEMFQRLSAEREGTGIGLAICKRIVELHGGRIWAESQPGIGSRFQVLLPDSP